MRPSQADFVRSLFCALEDHGIRYCVIHSWDDLCAELETNHDIDLAVHPSDTGKISRVFQALRERSYYALQCFNYAVEGYHFDFAWYEGLSLKMAAVDLAFAHWRGGLILQSGEELIAGRQKRGNLWIADPSIEFRYLLVKRVLKGTVSPRRQLRLKQLADQLGRSEAERLVGELFGGRWTKRIVDACNEGGLEALLHSLRRRFWWRRFARNPFQSVRYVARNATRLARRWLEPTGLTLVLLGPDGVGKSTIRDRLTQDLSPAFAAQRCIRWRPGILVPLREDDAAVTRPHAHTPRGSAGSALHAFGFFLDNWLGYLLVVRPLMTRTGLAIYDRYFHDLVVDQKRYRYGGPLWLVRLLLRFLPGPDSLLFVFDASEKLIWSRKQQLPREALRPLRDKYRQLAHRWPNAHLVKNGKGVEASAAAASRIVFEHLAKRFERRQPRWASRTQPIR